MRGTDLDARQRNLHAALPQLVERHLAQPAADAAIAILGKYEPGIIVGNAHAAKQTDGPPATDSAMAIDRHGRVARRRIPHACIRRASAGQYSNPGDDPVTKSKHPRSVGDICRDGHCGKRHHLPDRAMSIYSIRPEV